jgi:5-dehydro-4-deoxyglucarate dehydratase
VLVRVISWIILFGRVKRTIHEITRTNTNKLINNSSSWQVTMDPLELRSKLSGVIAFPITPFTRDLCLDLAGLRENLDRLLAHSVSAVVAAGGTGEMYSLTPAEHLQVIRTTVEGAAGRAPVIAGVGFGYKLGADLARAAEDAGADGILAFPPYYPNADDEGLLDYYRAIGAATSRGLLIYSRDWAHFTPRMVAQLATIANLIAWKDGQGDIRRLQSLIDRVGDRLEWIGGAGDDMVAAYYSLGIRAYTSSIATVAPRLSLRLHELAANNSRDELMELMRRCVIPLYSIRSRRKGYEVSTMKVLMDMAGLHGGPVRPPLVTVTDDEREELRAVLESWSEFVD